MITHISSRRRSTGIKQQQMNWKINPEIQQKLQLNRIFPKKTHEVTSNNKIQDEVSPSPIHKNYSLTLNRTHFRRQSNVTHNKQFFQSFTRLSSYQKYKQKQRQHKTSYNHKIIYFKNKYMQHQFNYTIDCIDYIDHNKKFKSTSEMQLAPNNSPLTEQEAIDTHHNYEETDIKSGGIVVKTFSVKRQNKMATFIYLQRLKGKLELIHQSNILNLKNEKSIIFTPIIVPFNQIKNMPISFSSQKRKTPSNRFIRSKPNIKIALSRENTGYNPWSPFHKNDYLTSNDTLIDFNMKQTKAEDICT